MYNSQPSYDKIYRLNNNYSFWYFNNYLRVAYIHKGWVTVWDHRQSPPTRYDCKNSDHHDACDMAIEKIHSLI